jgi:hypothetical protein
VISEWWPTSPEKPPWFLGNPDTALADRTIAGEADKAIGALPWLAQAREAITRARRRDSQQEQN